MPKNWYSGRRPVLVDIYLEDLDQDEVKQHVAEHFSPEDVFDTATLEDWARSHGFTEAEEE